MKSKILLGTLLAFICTCAAMADNSVSLTSLTSDQTVAPGARLDATWTNTIPIAGYLRFSAFEVSEQGTLLAEHQIIGPCFLAGQYQACSTMYTVVPDYPVRYMDECPVFLPTDFPSGNYRFCISIVDANGNLLAQDLSTGILTVMTASSAPIQLVSPKGNLSLTAGMSKLNIKFDATDVMNMVDVEFVGALDQSIRYSNGQIPVNTNGANKAKFTIRADIPPGDYTILLVGTNVTSGKQVYSLVSPLVHISSSIVTPNAKAKLKKGKSSGISWKGILSEDTETYGIYFQGDVTTEPLQIGTVPSSKHSARILVPQCPDSEGHFSIVGKGFEVEGNTFHFK